MEIIKLINANETREIFATDKKKFVEIQNALRSIIGYNAEHGIVINKVEPSEKHIDFYITVPEHSELKSEREFELNGIYLANQFKTKVTETLQEIYKITDNSSKLPRIKVNYTSSIGSKHTEEDSKQKLHIISESVKDNTYFPFLEHELF